MTTYEFDWKDTIHGRIEIDAENGVEAERLFRQMCPKERLVMSAIENDKGTLTIKYVDNGIGDIQTADEWSKTWKNIY